MLRSNCQTVTVLPKEAPANYVPAAAVIRRGQALSGFTGRKGCVGGLAFDVKALGLTEKVLPKLPDLRTEEETGTSWCSGKMRRYQKERR